MTRPRLVRNAPAPGNEFRPFAQDVAVRAKSTDDGAPTVLDGYASVTETPYTVRDWLGEYSEIVAAGAFAKTLAEQDDVRLLFNHDGLPLARTKSGTLDLDEDTTGLHSLAELDRRSQLVNDVAIAMERGDLDQMSFAFSVTRQQWSPDYEERRILEVKLYDVSVVTYPANDATSASLRSRTVADLALAQAGDPEDLRGLIGRAQRHLRAAAGAGDPALAHLRRDDVEAVLARAQRRLSADPTAAAVDLDQALARARAAAAL